MSTNAETGIQITRASLKSDAADFAEMTRTPPFYRKKEGISPELIEQVFKNKPFNGFDFGHSGISPDDLTVESFAELATQFLEREFFFFQELGISFSRAKCKKNEKIINKAIDKYESLDMNGQVDFLKINFNTMSATGTIFEVIQRSLATKQFCHSNLFLISEMNKIYSSSKLEKREKMVCNLAAAFDWKGMKKTPQIPMVILPQYLPELLMSCPVWFMEEKEGGPSLREGEWYSDALRHICDLVGTSEFAWLYQMYNHRTRKFKTFTGPDVMPLRIAENLPKLLEHFDFLVIATPYHSLAGKEWENPLWHNNYDPYLLGFKFGVSCAFMLDRWSGSGLFPNMADLIADTINHLKTNASKLSRFDSRGYWYSVNGSSDRLGDTLPKFGSALVDSFEKGELFEMLRGKKVCKSQ